MKRDKFDAAFSDLVRERADWTCEACHKYYPEGHRSGLECSHFFTRSRKSTRWHPHNAAAHCTKCHFNLGGNPIEFSDWIRNHLGSRKSAELISANHALVRWRKKDKEELYAQMKSELLRMRHLRSEGVRGRIDFDLPKVREMCDES